MNEEVKGESKHITPLRAIRMKCLDCCCGSNVEVSECPCEYCSLWVFRFGKNPNVKLSDEERERRSRMASMPGTMYTMAAMTPAKMISNS